MSIEYRLLVLIRKVVAALPFGGSPSIALVETTVAANGVPIPSSPGVEADSGAERNGGTDKHLEHSSFGAFASWSFIRDGSVCLS